MAPELAAQPDTGVDFLGILIRFTALRSIRDIQAEYMKAIYDFVDPPREDRLLEFLSQEFWQVLDQC